ncbi:MAG TPA: adhesion protein [Pseudoalteromonas sp.]|jgi:lipopolysaccharide/colanic/teichoic acid biosynthesis glycosyltransferase|nr:adhesion protein [Pseudoalteromonas sp.]|tara:strand:- start:7711 stop:9510 length:1800 start_codon:yes stop_codon:yes gene_type:complete
MTFLLITLAILIVLVLYHHVGYLLLLKIFSNDKVNIESNATLATTRFGILMCAYNEQEHIREKLYNLGSMLYSTEQYAIHIYLDGCTDKTYDEAMIAQSHLAKQNVVCHLHFNKINKGKSFGVNELIKLTKPNYDVLLFTDVSALLSVDVLNKIDTDFKDPQVNVITGVYILDDLATKEQQQYWQYQNKVKSMESSLGAVIGVPGAMFAIRAEYAQLLDASTINDDFILSMKALNKGGKALVNSEINIVERECDEQNHDYARRVRLGAGNWQQIKMLSELFNPKLGWVSFNYISHKVLRGIMPIILVLIYGLLISLAVFSNVFLAKAACITLAAVHGLGVLKQLLSIKTKWPVIDSINYIVTAYLCAFWGIIKFERGEYSKHWQRVHQTKQSNNLIIRAVKRSIDILGSAIGLIVLSPVMLMVALVIKFSSKGPVLFKQLRVGQSDDDFVALFNVLKFRSMVVDAEVKSGAVWASKDDPRITPVGRFIRKTRLDELPQLWNVLIGDMSLIGPRPERPVFYSKLEKDIPYFCQRTYGIKPGISGLAQVMNGYDETIDDARNKIGWDYAYMLSTSSARSWCYMELTIFFKTLVVIFTGKGQ